MFTDLLTEIIGNRTIMSVFALGVIFQILLVMTLLKLSFQDSEYESSVHLFKAFIYAFIFVLGAPVMSMAVSALFVLGFPHIAKYLDVLTLVLGSFPNFDAAAAATSRPLGYSLAILSTIAFLAWMISHANSHGEFGWRHVGYVALALVGAVVLCQFAVYFVMLTMRAG